MLRDIKQILFSEIKDELEEYDKAKKRIEDIKSRLHEIDLKLGWYSFDENNQALKKPNKPSLIMRRFSFWDKYIFKRKEYIETEKKNKELQAKYEEELAEYNRQCNELDEENNRLHDEKEQLESFCKEKETIRERFETIKSAQTLKGLNIGFNEAVELLKENEVELVLDDSDKVITRNDSEFDSPSDYVLVHKTKYKPTEDSVKSQLSSGVTEKDTVYFGDEEFSIEYQKARSTVHFCLNGEVSSHAYGNFDKRRYAVILPFENIETGNLASFNPEDTFFNGEVNTQRGYILCPKDDVEIIKELNPNTIIIGYEGDTVDGYANAFLSMLGYKYENVGEHSWQFDEDMTKHSKFIKQHANLKYNTHAYSKEYKRDELIQDYYKFMGFVRSLQEYKHNGKIYDVDTLVYELFNFSNKTSYQDGGDFVERKNARIVPNITDLLDDSLYIHDETSRDKGVFLKDFIDEDFIDTTEDSKQSNLKFLLYKLKKDFNIEISEELLEILSLKLSYSDRKDKPTDDLYQMISNKNAQKLVKKMYEDGYIETIDDVQNVLFAREIIEQSFIEKELSRKSNEKNIQNEEER